MKNYKSSYNQHKMKQADHVGSTKNIAESLADFKNMAVREMVKVLTSKEGYDVIKELSKR